MLNHQILLETERLIVLHLRPSDFGAVREIQRDEQTMEFFGSKPGARLTDEKIASNFNIMMTHCSQFGFSYGPVFEKATGVLIGNTGISHLDFNPEDPTIEIGYFLLPEFWGQGFASELAPCLIETALKILEAPKVVATVDASNTPSCNICEKMQMRFEGQFPYETLQGKMLNNYAVDPTWTKPKLWVSTRSERDRLPTPATRTVFKCMGSKDTTMFAVPAISLSSAANPELIRSAIDMHNLTLIHTDSADLESQRCIKEAVRDVPREYLIFSASSTVLDRAAFEATCERLGTNYLDIYYLDGLTEESVTETMNTMNVLQQAKKIKGISLTNVSQEVIQAAHAIYPLTSVLVNYSLWNRDAVTEKILHTCKLLDIRCISSTALPVEHSCLSELEELANSERCSPEQLAQAWVLQQGCLIQSSAKNSIELERDVASGILRLRPETLRELDRLFPKNIEYSRSTTTILFKC